MIGFPRATTADQTWARRRPFPLYAEHGMVAAAHPLTAEAGLHVLREGGNAIDAAVSAGLVAAVVMPEMCGLGGDLFAVIHMPGVRGGSGETVSVQGSGISPRGALIEQMRAQGDENGTQMPYQGPLSISVPGMIDAYEQLLNRYGTKSFAEVAETAITLARDGFILQPLGARSIAGNADILARDAAAAAIFLPEGKPLQAGERLRQADLGRTIETIAADGAETFYRGKIAKRITAYLASVGGALTMDDFADHETDIGAPLRTTYRGHTVYQTAIPSQGLILLEALNIIANETIDDPLSADAIHLMVEAKKLAYADRLGHAADAAFHQTPLETLLSPEWGKKRYAEIAPHRAAATVPPGRLQDGDTTYLSVVDGNGAMVSLIQSVSSAFGSCVVGGDTGVVLNNRVGRGFTLEDGHVNQYAPGKKTMHTLNCYLVADPEGRPVLVGGTPGGDGQPQWNMQAISGMLDGGLDVQAAIEMPRWTSWPGTDPAGLANPFELRIEDRMPADVVAELESRGHAVRLQGGWNGGGSAQTIARDPETGVLIGGTDSRVEGMVLGF
ncbi:MAG: gamma-glutamyltransferase [Chloroflexia bacterium]|nr:gamma-glutamyltransferase [Chloroflexia bacterium]